MSDKPQYLTPWCCPKCGAVCSGNIDSTQDGDGAVGYIFTCECGCRFIHWETITYAPYCVEVDNVEYEYPQEPNLADVSHLVEEYRPLADEYGDILSVAVDDIVAWLAKDHNWTPDGGRVLLDLAQRYGSFILKHALALALVLDIEDGSEGL